MNSEHEKYLLMAIEQAGAARDAGNDPFGSVLVHKGRVIAGQNQAVTHGDPTAHSETMAIRNAAAELGTNVLAGATLYTSFEPCPMCMGAILQVEISTLVIGERFVPGNPSFSDYSVDALLAMTGRADGVTVVTGLCAEQAHAFYGQGSQ